jgi:glycosyltransferase involved in cell wall biosynthesis
MAELASPKLCIVIPAFNEADNIAAVISDIRSHVRHTTIVVVDDGSPDDTFTIATSLGVVALRLPVNLGIGGAVQTGLKYAVKNGFDIAVQFDGDGQHLASELPTILAPVIDGVADVAIGSRFKHGHSAYRAGAARTIGIRVISWVNSLLIRQRITDPTSGFRAYNRRALVFLEDDYPQDYPEPEAIIALSRNRYRILEIAVEMKPRAKGKSSISAWSACFYMIKVLLAILITSIRTRKPEV